VKLCGDAMRGGRLSLRKRPYAVLSTHRQTAACPDGDVDMRKENEVPRNMSSQATHNVSSINTDAGCTCKDTKGTGTVGLENIGETCWLNSTVQALYHCPAFQHWLCTLCASRGGGCESVAGALGATFREMQEVLTDTISK
jgi:hypothetical protein